MKEHLFLSSFWLIYILRAICADYQFELQLLRYQNPSHRLAATERCCDSDLGLIQCSDHCDNTFLLCLSPPGQADCSLGQVSTGTLYVPDPNKSDIVEFLNGGSYIANGVQNPLVFIGRNWPGGFELVVIVGDEDVDGGEEAVDELRLSQPLVRPDTRFSSTVEIRGNGGRGFLRLNYRLTCTGNYTGDTCSLCSAGQCTDDDEAVVGIERTIYSVTEDEGVVEVCAIVYSPTITCPIEFPFNVSLSTRDSTAEERMDYIGLSKILKFFPCVTRQCVNMTIVVDLVDEPMEEFDITLERTIGLSSRVTLNPVNARVLILLDDGKIPVPAVISLTASPSSDVMAGDTVTLNCSVTLPIGVTGTPEFQWEGPGVIPTPADPIISGQEVSSVLTLSSISTSQAGQYTCTATLNGTRPVTSSVTVTINSPSSSQHL